MGRFPRVKIFSSHYDDPMVDGYDWAKDLEGRCNRWLIDNQNKIEVISIQYTSTLCGETDDDYPDAVFSVCIFFEDLYDIKKNQ